MIHLSGSGIGIGSGSGVGSGSGSGFGSGFGFGSGSGAGAGAGYLPWFYCLGSIALVLLPGLSKTRPKISGRPFRNPIEIEILCQQLVSVIQTPWETGR